MEGPEIVDNEKAPGATAGMGKQAPASMVPEALRLNLQLPVFEGPLDLLLHLVREHKLDILDIPITFITDRYLELIDRMQEMNLDVAGEYLLMAATLAHIKSRMLLPRPEVQEDDEEDEGDPRADLVQRLLAYQKYRDAATMLARQDLLGRDVFARSRASAPIPRDPGDPGLREVSVIKLIEALDTVLQKVRPELAHEVGREEISVADRISVLVDRLRLERELTFAALFDDARSRSRIIATFLALLEMARLGLCRVRQPEPEGEILVGAGEGLHDQETPLTPMDDYR